jgi:isoleucyl-tRNA synthetase
MPGETPARSEHSWELQRTRRAEIDKLIPILGRRVVYVPGWDCHGLPIEIKALEKHHRTHHGELLDAVSIRKAARALSTKTVKDQMKGFREWGIMADWEKAWRTTDKSFEIKQLEVFREMVKRGLIFRRFKPVYWSPSSKTALAEAELEYKDDHESLAAYIAFPITQAPQSIQNLLPGGSGKLSALIWTTTPWTLPANRAIAVNSELEYSIVSRGADLFIVAKSRLTEVLQIMPAGSEFHVVVDSLPGRDLQGMKYQNPLRGKESVTQPLILADFVSADSGTGLVHCAPGHGMDDYEVCTRLGIPAVSPVDDNGCFTGVALPDNPSALEGTSVTDGGSRRVLDLLDESMVLATHPYKHKYPYDWRTKLPVIVRATEQWFADVGSVKDDALRRLKDVRFIPDGGQSRIESFVKGRSEWCISRQRAWGVPIPALYGEDGKAVVTEESVNHIISVIQDRGIDAWWTDAQDDPAWLVPGMEGSYLRGKDTMDVWFDSGTSWTQTPQQADVYLEGTDQHRGWFQSSLLTHTCASGKGFAPFKTLITHGFTLDQDGRKMSKSIGNVIAPKEIMDGSILPAPTSKKKGTSQVLGADALRLWVAGCDYTRDVVIGQPLLKANHSALVKYRVMLKMLLGSMHKEARTAPITKLDQIALSQLETTMTEVAAAYDNFEFYKGLNAINRWISNDLSAVYFEAAKDRLYCADGGGVVEEIFQGLLRMLTPIVPSLVEEAWDHRPQWMKEEDQAHPFHRILTDQLTERNPKPAEHVQGDIPWLLNANAAIKAAQEQARSKKLIGSSLESSVVLQLPPDAQQLFSRYADELDSIFVSSSVSINEPVEGDWQFSAPFATPNGEVSGMAWAVPAKDAKCPRCWRFVAPAEDKLCRRCEGVVGV